jgi:hypothetical protein
MSKNPKMPETWGIPDDQANKVREALSKKSIKPEDAVQKAIEEIARDIAIIESDPKDWGWWVCYLLEELETHAKNRRLIDQYEYCLNVLGEKMRDRVEGGQW